jgi:TP901 family phage tail tape measure protein
MATVLGSLLVSLGLESSQFRRGTKEAQTAMGGLSAKMAVVGAAITAAVGGAAYEFVKLTRETINTADEISKAAVKIGISTEELSRLRYAADLSGLSFEQLQKGLLVLNRNMAGIGGESKKVSTAFAQLGIETRNADGSLKSSTEVLKELADAFAQMPDGAEKSALAMAVLGKSGADLIPLLNGGAAELAKLTEEADKFGIVIDTETGLKAEQFNDNLDRLQGAFGALATRVAAELLPHLVDFTEWLIKNQGEIVQSVGNLGNFVAGVSRMASAVANGVAWMEERFGRLFRTISAIINPLSNLVSLATRLGGGGGNSGGPIGQTAGAMMTMAQNAIGTAKAMRTLGIESDGAGKKLGGSVGGGARAASAALRPLRDEVRDLVERLFPELGSRAKMAELALLNQAAAQGKITEQMRLQGRLRLLGVNDNPEVSSDLIGEGPLDGAKRVAASADIVNKSLEELRKNSEKQTVRVAKTFADMTTDVIGSFQQLTSAIRGGGFLDILGAVIGLGLQLGQAGLFGGKVQTNLNKAIPGFANGTNFAPGGLSLVGERGPELVNLPRGAGVMSNRELRSLGGSTSVQVIPSPYFDVVVDGRIMQSAPAIAGAGAAMAQGQMAARQARRVR